MTIQILSILSLKEKTDIIRAGKAADRLRSKITYLFQAWRE